MYVGNHDLGNGIYNVEILFSQTDDLVISAQHSELSDSFIIEIEAAKVGHLLDEFQNNFEAMATHLKIYGNSITRFILIVFKCFKKWQ